MTTLNIRQARDALGLTQPALAALLGVHWTSVSNWEAERTKPRMPAVKLIERLLRDDGLNPSRYRATDKPTRKTGTK